MCGAINLFSEDCETKNESGNENIERFKVSGSDDEHEAVFQRDIMEMLWILWICMNDIYFVHIQFIALIRTIVGH
jgi:hypothetical protein